MRLTRICGTIRDLAGDRAASAMAIFGFALIPMVAAAGLATDSLMGMLARSEMARAVDAAALAGARSINSPTRDAEIRRLFAMNFPEGRLGVTLNPLSISADPRSGTVQVTATGSMPTSLMKVLHYDEMNLRASATAEAGGARSGIELALVLDTTGSMNDADNTDPHRAKKITGLKKAANSLLDTLYQGKETVENLWVSVIPFAGRVNVSQSASPRDRGWGDGFGLSGWNGCFDIRPGSNAYNDENPTGQKFPEFVSRRGARMTADSVCPASAAMPLTAEKSVIKSKIDSLVPKGNTRTDIGLSWGWRSLSPKWQGFWGGNSSLPLNYHTENMTKAVVLITDGINTPELTNDTESQAQTLANLNRQCEDMKAAGIVIYTILFQTEPWLNPYYQRCASTDETFIVAGSNEALNAAFSDIGIKLRNKYVRLTQ